MKKLIIFFLLLSIAGFASAQSPDPFSGSHWQGKVSYKDPDNRSRSDLYDLILVKNNTCIVTVTTTAARKELFQDGDGQWSFDKEGNIFRLECEFFDVAIEHIPYIDWKSVYKMDSQNNTFTLLIRPYPEAKSNVSIRFNRVDD